MAQSASLNPEPLLPCGIKVFWCSAMVCNGSVSELTWPVVNHLHIFHRLAQKVVGIFREQDNYFSNASNKIDIYIKRPRVLKIELEVVDEALLNFLLHFQYHSQFLLLFLIID